jgi:hypothetical protein
LFMQEMVDRRYKLSALALKISSPSGRGRR